MYVEVSTYNSEKDTRPHSHKVSCDHLQMIIDSKNNNIEIRASEQEGRINGKRLMDYDVNMVELNNYIREAIVILSCDDLSKILQIALDNNLLSVQVIAKKRGSFVN